MTMLRKLGLPTLEALVDEVVPAGIRLNRPLALRSALSEAECLKELRSIAEMNQVWRTYIGQGFYGTHTPTVIQRNVLENPGWYTAYTPYQAEIAQGRLEALLNYQTLIAELTGLPIANASLLDEPTAGMSPEETLVMMELIRTLASERTVILVEHKMKLIMGLCKRIIVLHHGEFLAEGTPEEIQNNAEVRRVYLGQG